MTDSKDGPIDQRMRRKWPAFSNDIETLGYVVVPSVTDEQRIEEFFLKDGKWELQVVREGHPNSISGRWLWLSDANYGFRPADLAKAIKAHEANQEKAK